MFTISRAVVQVNPKFHPDGKRFFVKEYPKDREWRRVKVSEQLAKKINAHIKTAALNQDDLLFASRAEMTPKPRRRTVPDPEALGLTDPNDSGRRYGHGTLSGYNAGKCRCQHCKDTFAIYRATRRGKGRDTPRAPRAVDTDGHISRDWFRNQVWTPARDAAGLTFKARIHDLRHAHAYPGCWLAELTFRSSKSGWDTAASRPPSGTFTRFPTRTRRQSTRSTPSGTARQRTAGNRVHATVEARGLRGGGVADIAQLDDHGAIAEDDLECDVHVGEVDTREGAER